MAEPAKLLLVESVESYDAPRAIELSSETTTLGRSSKMCTVVLDATPTKSISRKHAEIVCKKGRRGGSDKYILRDLGSTNGVFVNEVKIREQPLEHDDVVQFGGAADIPVGTRFGGTGSHIRYRFDHKLAPPAVAQDSRKRRQADEPAPDAPAAQRAKKPERSNTINAAEALRAISNGGSLARTENGGGSEGAPVVGSSVGDMAYDPGETSALVVEVLGDAMCGLCSELLLDAGVLPCSHSFCRLCWADHVEEKGTTCPVCLRKMHSSERNPRRCSSLDLLVTSIVHKLAGPRERERWKARQAHAQKKEAAAAGNQASRNHGPAAVARKAGTSTTTAAAAASVPSPARGAHLAENGGTTSNGRKVVGKRGQQDQDQPRGAPGTASRRGNSRSSGGSGGGSGGSGAATAVAVAVKCEGCNEEGHDFAECPHRSDSALEGSGEEEESDEYQDEQEEEGDDEDNISEDDDEDYIAEDDD